MVTVMPGHYIYRHRVTFDETNLIGNVYFAHYLHWQGHCREFFLADRCPGVVASLSDGFALVTVDCGAEFFAESRALDEIEVRMTLQRVLGNRVTMSFEYLRTGPGPVELLARGHQGIACMQRAEHGLLPAPIPQELIRALAPYGPVGNALR